MSELQSKTCEIVMKSPDEILRPIFELLSQMYLFNGDAYESDLEYFKSIPGYLESLDAAANTPWEECVDESEVVW